MRSGPADVRKALAKETATRELIRSSNLVRSKSSPLNRPIRQTLGFREIGLTGGCPKFASRHVTKLYKELDQMAKEALPLSNEEEIFQAWDDRSLCHDIMVIEHRYGPKIWGDALDQRQPGNKQSQLLVEGEAEFCTTDLFWAMSPDYMFILLQLEHLMFVKAITFHRNHYKGKAVEETRHVEDSPSRKKTVEVKSLVVNLSLRSDKLRRFPHKQDHGVKRKRKSHGHHGSNDKPTVGRRGQKYRIVDVSSDDDDENNVTYTYATRVNQAPSASAADHNQYVPTSVSFGRLAPEAVHAVRRASAQTLPTDDRRNSFSVEDSMLTPVLDDSFGYENQVGLPADTPTLNKGSNVWSTGPNIPSARFSSSRDTECTVLVPQSRSRNVSKFTSAKAAKAEGDDVLAVQGLVRRRTQLRLLLLGELCNFQHAHSRSEDLHEMWTKSRELDDTFKSLWEEEQKRIEGSLGQEFEKIDKVVREWLEWRGVAKTLGELACMHPSEEGKNLPHFTFNEWVAKLGGEEQYWEMDWKLTQHENAIQARGRDVISEQITSAFAAATSHPKAVHVFKKGVVNFLEKLSSWRDDFDL